MKKAMITSLLCIALVFAILTTAFAATSPLSTTHVHSFQLTSKVPKGSSVYENPTYHKTTYTVQYTCSDRFCSAIYCTEIKDVLEVHNGTYCTACHRQIIMDVPGEIMGVDDEHDC